MSSMDEFYEEAEIKIEEELFEDLGRDPTDAELSAAINARVGDVAQELYENAASAAYDLAKDCWKYGE